jgi:hypothetical protein
MKTYYWLNQNRFGSHLRIATAGAIDLITKNASIRDSVNRSGLRRVFLLILLVLVCFGLSPVAKALLPTPPPDGGYPGANTAEGTNALFSLTSGIDNNAFGFQALYHNATGSYNTANGVDALFSNTTGNNNTADGVQALYYNPP